MWRRWRRQTSAQRINGGRNLCVTTSAAEKKMAAWQQQRDIWRQQ